MLCCSKAFQSCTQYRHNNTSRETHHLPETVITLRSTSSSAFICHIARYLPVKSCVMEGKLSSSCCNSDFRFARTVTNFMGRGHRYLLRRLTCMCVCLGLSSLVVSFHAELSGLRSRRLRSGWHVLPAVGSGFVPNTLKTGDFNFYNKLVSLKRQTPINDGANMR